MILSCHLSPRLIKAVSRPQFSEALRKSPFLKGQEPNPPICTSRATCSSPETAYPKAVQPQRTVRTPGPGSRRPGRGDIGGRQGILFPPSARRQRTGMQPTRHRSAFGRPALPALPVCCAYGTARSDELRFCKAPARPASAPCPEGRSRQCPPARSRYCPKNYSDTGKSGRFPRRMMPLCFSGSPSVRIQTFPTTLPPAFSTSVRIASIDSPVEITSSTSR